MAPGSCRIPGWRCCARWLTLFEAGDGWRYRLGVTSLSKRARGWRGQLAHIDAAHRATRRAATWQSQPDVVESHRIVGIVAGSALGATVTTYGDEHWFPRLLHAR